jgi:hypothetical protein
MEYWNGGKMECWVGKADNVLIVIFDESHLFSKRFYFAIPNIPVFQYPKVFGCGRAGYL